MHYQLLDREEVTRQVGAAVVRSTGGAVVLELGPADGAPFLRCSLAHDEAIRLSAALKAVASGKGEEILIVDD